MELIYASRVQFRVGIESLFTAPLPKGSQFEIRAIEIKRFFGDSSAVNLCQLPTSKKFHKGHRPFLGEA